MKASPWDLRVLKGKFRAITDRNIILIKKRCMNKVPRSNSLPERREARRKSARVEPIYTS